MQFIILFFLLIGFDAFAQETTTTAATPPESKIGEVMQKNGKADDLFKDKLTVKYMLRSQGIEPTQINWTSVALLCSPMQNVSEVAQNKCEYEKARMLFAHNQESNFCRKFSESFYSSQRITQNQTQRYIMVDNAGNRSEVSLTQLGGTIGKAKSLQTAEYLRCMKNHGWVNPDNWQAGKDSMTNYY